MFSTFNFHGNLTYIIHNCEETIKQCGNSLLDILQMDPRVYSSLLIEKCTCIYSYQETIFSCEETIIECGALLGSGKAALK